MLKQGQQFDKKPRMHSSKMKSLLIWIVLLVVLFALNLFVMVDARLHLSVNDVFRAVIRNSPVSERGILVSGISRYYPRHRIKRCRIFRIFAAVRQILHPFIYS